MFFCGKLFNFTYKKIDKYFAFLETFHKLAKPKILLRKIYCRFEKEGSILKSSLFYSFIIKFFPDEEKNVYFRRGLQGFVGLL